MVLGSGEDGDRVVPLNRTFAPQRGVRTLSNTEDAESEEDDRETIMPGAVRVVEGSETAERSDGPRIVSLRAFNGAKDMVVMELNFWPIVVGCLGPIQIVSFIQHRRSGRDGIAPSLSCRT